MSPKTVALGVMRGIGLVAGLVPRGLRTRLVFALLVLESRIGRPDDAMRQLYHVQDDLERILAERAMAYGDGIHPKHRLTRYHEFFVDRIGEKARVLVIGCGYGEVARAIARARPNASVAGVEIEADLVAQARILDNPPNLSFLCADATRSLPDGPWDTVVLSNILEHLQDRVGFLKALIAAQQPQDILIRVPAFERHWHIPMRRELAITFFSDRTHFIEHTQDEFHAEIEASGLVITEMKTIWGEIWAACRSDDT
ncbi:MAG: class I SAM-dependent methyltransferase [Rhodospirillaceae bacterium]|nr:class I SAM-dependent methyltransferase [Rhodospirillaceae bacterium]